MKEMRRFFLSGQTRSLSYRLQALNRLKEAVKKYEPELLQALNHDLHKSEFEAYATEIGIVLHEIRYAIQHLKSWMKPQRVKTPFTHFGSKSYIYAEPFGVALIISPWNFPFQLAVMPLIGAIAAGNCAVLKPSELTPATSDVLSKLIAETFPPAYITVTQGGPKTSEALLEEQWDTIFFTGSPAIGRLVMQAAAKRLTPVTLELGGKSPCIVHKDARLSLAAKRIAWGKFINAGQTCIAPDFIYVHRDVKAAFLERFASSIRELYGDDPLAGTHLSRIINERHFTRLSRLLRHEHIYMGGRTDPESLRIEPTVLTDITWDDTVMQEEIFGPIMPVLVYDDLTDVLDTLQHKEKPLSLYLFSEDIRVQEEVVSRLPFGGGCINDTVYHFTTPHLPFGGTGTSGLGAYHGKASFDAFSHRKSILKQTTRFDIPFRYANAKNALRIIRRILK